MAFWSKHKNIPQTDKNIPEVKAVPEVKPVLETVIQVELSCDKEALKSFKLVAVAYSHVDREWFPTQESFEAEVEVEERATQVVEEIKKLGINAKAYPGDQYFLTNLLVDKPDLVLNLVDTLKGKDRLQTSVPAALELSNIPYTGAEMDGLVIGNNRNLVKHLLQSYNIPTPNFQFIRRAGTSVDESLGLPLIIKLNESGGSVGIDNKAVQESYKDAQKKIDKMLDTYKMPVIVEQFIDGREITAVVFDDGTKNHVFLGEKVFKLMPDGKHKFTSFESYEEIDSYKYKKVDGETAAKLSPLVVRAFNGLLNKDYAKFDIRIDEKTGVFFFTDCNPNTAFGPDKGLPFTEVLDLHGINFSQVLSSLLSKYAEKPKKQPILKKRRQQISEAHCGPAVVEMLLENVGILKTQQEITIAAGASDTIKEHGTRVDQLALAVKELASNFVLYYKENASISDIKILLSDYNLPVGVEWHGIFEATGKDGTDGDDEDYGHYSVITHVDEGKKALIIVDPYKDYVTADRIIDIDKFLKRWWDTNEVIDSQTGKKKIVKDDKLLFVITSKNPELLEKLGLKTYY
jgi:D-alanine-D-alanine ligase